MPAKSLVVLCVLLGCTIPATASTYFTAVLDGPTADTDSPATGFAVLVLNDDETEVSYHIEYSGMLGTETVAHIHNAPPGVVGPLFHDLPYGSPKAGTWPVGPYEVSELYAGRANILIHSDLYPVAEIRGDLVFAGVADVPEQPGALLSLAPNYPDPFNPRTTLVFTLAVELPVEVAVLDVRGRRVRVLTDGVRPAGEHRVAWDGRDDRGAALPAGIYLARVGAAGQVRTESMVLVK